MYKKIFSPLIWILVFQFISYFIGQLTKANIATWYQTLNKSILQPPAIVFPIIWGILYVMLALVGWSLWINRKQRRGKIAFWLYSLQMLMNWTWTPIFFSLHFIALGFYWITIMVVMTFSIIVISLKDNKFASILLIPYWFWLIFAGYLNWVIWLKN